MKRRYTRIRLARTAAVGLTAGLGFLGTSPASAQDTPVPVPVPAGTTATPAAGTPTPGANAPAPAIDDPDRTYNIGEIVVGDHVQVDPSLMNQWRPCVVVQVKTMPYDANMIRGFVVRCEDGNPRDVMASPRMVKK